MKDTGSLKACVTGNHRAIESKEKRMAKATKEQKIKEDVWIRTTCGMCYASCAMRVRRVNGVAVKVEGDPDSDYGARGGLCGKGMASLQYLYDPNRCNYPVRRTNPEKGIGVDPKWKRISWDEALGEIGEKLKKLKADNPNKLFIMGSPSPGMSMSSLIPLFLWAKAFDTENTSNGGAGLHCGSASHMGAGMNHAAWSALPDYAYCNYVIHFGANKGTGAGHSAAMLMRKAADARRRGMKAVVFDPVCNFAGGKAREWVPILPGTDLAVALAMANVIVNQLGIYDEEYLKKKTNAPYLIKPDGEYARDTAGQPLLWDETNSKSIPWNDPEVLHVDVALEGEYEVEGIKCQPVFVLLKEQWKKYTPQWAEDVSTVPAATIGRIAQEFAENARIGSTINIRGVNLPYRPVAAIQFRGGSGHSNGFHTYFSVNILNHLVGAADVPGGLIGWPSRCFGFPGTGNPKFEPFASTDGFLRCTIWAPGIPGAWPHSTPVLPQKLNLLDLFSTSSFSLFPWVKETEEMYQKLEVPYRAEVLLQLAGNPLMTIANPDTVAEQLKKFPLIISIVTMHNETTESFADIVLPDTSFLESLSCWDAEFFSFNHPTGMDDWYWHIRQPVVKPMYERRFAVEVLTDLADRIGMRKEWNSAINAYLMLFTLAPMPYPPEAKLSWEEMVDGFIKARFGSEHDLNWFKEHGFITWPKKVEESYWRWFVDARASIYAEFLVAQLQGIKEICEPRGIPIDYEQYTPLPSYFPTVVHKSTDPQYDLIAFSYRDILHTGHHTLGTPWLLEASDMNPFTFKVTMHVKAAEERELKDGDMICIENERGVKIKGTLHTIESQHPRTVAICSVGGGHWAKSQPLAKGRGVCFNYLLPAEWGYNCPITSNIETSVKVRVYKAETGKEIPK
jgi:molybdopterin-containing oxidoreductase family molybdopterin binding subunit